MIEGMLNDICGVDLFDTILNTLSVNLFSSSGDFSSALTIAKSMHETVIKPVALMLVFLYFMIAVVDKMSSENFTWEQLWRQMAMLLAAKLLIDYGFTLLETMFNIGMTLASQIEALLEGKGATGNKTPNFDAAEMVKGFEESLGLTGVMKVLSGVIMFIYLLIPWCLSWILGMAVKIICYTRVIEIYVRAIFYPFAISDFFHGGLQSGGWRFIKNFFAVCLQGGVILVIASMFSVLFSDIVVNESNLFSFTGLYLSFLAAAVMLMFKSLSLTKEILGTG